MSYSHSEVAHNFANRTGLKQNGGNVFYEIDGDFYTIYSYGKHFAIATILPDGGTALFTEQDYSNSTAKHKLHVSRAMSHLNVITVPRNTDAYYHGEWNGDKFEYSFTTGQEFYRMAKEDLETWNQEIEKLVGKQQRARTRDYSEQITNIVQNAIKYAELFEVLPVLTGGIRKAHREEWTETQIIDHYLGQDYLQELEAKRKEEQRKEKAAIKTSLEKFKNFEKSNVDHRAKFTYLRVKFGDNRTKYDAIIETSKGVRIKDLEKAKRLFRCCQLALEKGQDLTDCFQEPIENFRINKIYKNGTIQAGCHIIPFKESKAAAQQLGWI